MLEEIFKSSEKCAQLRAGLLGPYIDGFVVAERDQGFSCLTVYNHLRVVEALSQWLDRCGIRIENLNEARLTQFIRWRKRRHNRRRDGHNVLSRMLAHLRAQGVVKPGCAQELPTSKDEEVVLRFERHLARDRGFVPSTIRKYGSLVREFIQVRFSTRHLRLESLQVPEIQSFITDFAEQRGRSRAKDLIQALRTFLRWLQASGLIAIDLAAGIVGVASWRLGSVPATLTQREVRRLLRACDRHSLKGRRDFAVLMLLARLGLRAGEVVKLEIDDIDWRRAELTVHRKPGREDRLPLPRDVGEALVAYLRYVRPPCSERRVFICMNAPHRALGRSATVSSIVSAALKRAGLTPCSRGAHLLRHSLATQLLRQGATMAEIGGVLGHESAGATEIYAKVDISALRTVAQPWPGGSR
jgi:integrase/recombinase XerD